MKEDEFRVRSYLSGDDPGTVLAELAQETAVLFSAAVGFAARAVAAKSIGARPAGAALGESGNLAAPGGDFVARAARPGDPLPAGG